MTSSFSAGGAAFIVMLMLTGAPTSVAHAAESVRPAAMTDLELARVRGGYFSANGITFGFGATVSTYVDGSFALESRLTVTDAGVLQSQTAGTGANLMAFDPATAQAAGLAGLVGQGVVVGGDGGVSTVVQNLTGNQILNVVLNGANNRTITQNTAVTLTLPQFNQLQQATAAQQLSASLLSAVGVGAVGALRH